MATMDRPPGPIKHRFNPKIKAYVVQAWNEDYMWMLKGLNIGFREYSIS
jgi:hypothetical protein